MHRKIDSRGFTLVELLVASTLGMLVFGGVCRIYISQQTSYHIQQTMLNAQQNVRSAFVIMEQQIRLVGYDPMGSGRFGIKDIRRYSLVGTQPDEEGSPALFYTIDEDENGEVDDSNFNHNGEHRNFRIRDDKNLGRLYLSFDMGSGRQPLAENICEMGLAYAVDVDRDGHPDCWKNGSQLIWAVDSDNDNLLDTHLDANEDGRIDTMDDVDGDLRITAADGALINPPVELDRVCAVRIWLLSKTAETITNHLDQGVYVVGDSIISQPMDGYRRNILEGIVYCRNL